MTRRVVVTGLGVIAPNGRGLMEFEEAIRKGESGIRHQEMAAAPPLQLVVSMTNPLPLRSVTESLFPRPNA